MTPEQNEWKRRVESLTRRLENLAPAKPKYLNNPDRCLEYVSLALERGSKACRRWRRRAEEAEASSAAMRLALLELLRFATKEGEEREKAQEPVVKQCAAALNSEAGKGLLEEVARMQEVLEKCSEEFISISHDPEYYPLATGMVELIREVLKK